MSLLCDRCEEREATVEWVQCGQALTSDNSEAVTTSTIALLCDHCSMALGNLASKGQHMIIPLALKKLKEKADREFSSLQRAIAERCQQLYTEQQIEDTKTRFNKLESEIRIMVAKLREILNSREAALLSFVMQQRDHMLNLLEKQKKDQNTMVEEASQLAKELEQTLQHPMEELVSLQHVVEEQLEKMTAQSVLHHPSSSLFYCGTSQNTSTAIGNELPTPPLPPLPSSHPGQLCSFDGRVRGMEGGGEWRMERRKGNGEEVERLPFDGGQQVNSGVIREQWNTPKVSLPIPREAAADWSLFSRSQRPMNIPTASFSMKLTSFSSFQPGSPAHMLKFFTEYLKSHGGEQPMFYLCCAYRGKYKLKREQFWLDTTFFECYPHMFAVKTVDSKPWIKLIRD